MICVIKKLGWSTVKNNIFGICLIQKGPLTPLLSQISTSVCWEPATVGEESAASTPRAHFVARERSAVELAMNSLTTTIAKVS